jgi:hypothetical protein
MAPDPEELARALKDTERRLADYHNVLLAVRDYLKARANRDVDTEALYQRVRKVLSE